MQHGEPSDSPAPVSHSRAGAHRSRRRETSASATPSRGINLPRLTSLRALAALIVFGYHIGHHTSWLPGARITSHGYVGVAFFFVLSGFVLTWSTSPGTSARTFWIRRFARVYPSHAAMFAVALALPVLAFPPTLVAAGANLVLLQAWFPQWDIAFGINAVSWSLSCEAFFYLLAPLVIRAARARSLPRAGAILGTWAAVCAVTAASLSLQSQAWDIALYTNPLARSGEFVLGILIAIAVERGVRPRLHPALPAVGILGWWLALTGVGLPQTVVDVSFVPLFALTILSLALADLEGRRSILRWRWAVYAGEVSFAFYLVHELVIMNLAALVGDGGTHVQRVAYPVLALALSTVAAIALHHGVERPAQKWIRARWLKAPG